MTDPSIQLFAVALAATWCLRALRPRAEMRDDMFAVHLRGAAKLECVQRRTARNEGAEEVLDGKDEDAVGQAWLRRAAFVAYLLRTVPLRAW